MEKSDVLYFYGRLILQSCIFLFFIYIALRKKNITDNCTDITIINWLKTGKNQLHYEMIFRSCTFIIAIVLIICNISYFKDIPYLQNKKYKEIKGTAQSGDHRRNDVNRRRYVSIIEEGTNKVYKISFFDNYVNIGEHITIICFPNTGFGTRIEE